MRERVVPVVMSVVIILAVAVAQERSRHLAAIIATMPLTAPLAMWIVFSASGGDPGRTADFVGSMVLGSVASLIFVLACWVGLRQGCSLVNTVAFAAAVWLVVVLAPRWVGHSPR